MRRLGLCGSSKGFSEIVTTNLTVVLNMSERVSRRGAVCRVSGSFGRGRPAGVGGPVGFLRPDEEKVGGLLGEW